MIRNNSKPWFYLESELNLGSIKLSQDICQHLKAKRLEPNAQIVLFNTKGILASATLEQNNCAIITELEQPKSEHKIELALPYCEPKLISQCLIQAVELGASRIYLTHTEYSYSNASHKRIQAKHIEKWQLQMIQACQQSENPFIPELIVNQTLKELINKPADLIVMGFSSQTIKLTEKPAILFVGPEGGFSPKEQQLFINHNAQCLHIGTNILKVATAVTAGLTALQIFNK